MAYHHGNLRAALLAAALELTRDGGVAAVSLRTVAARAGVSRAAPYHHFPDKDAILADVAAAGFDMLAAELVRAPAVAAVDPWLQLRALGRAYLRFALREPALMRLMFSDLFSAQRSRFPELLLAEQRSLQALQAVIATCAATPQARPLPLPTLTLSAWSTLHGLALLRIGGQLPADLSADGLTEPVLDLLLAALQRGDRRG